MHNDKLNLLIGLLVAFLFFLPPAAALNTTSGIGEGNDPEAVTQGSVDEISMDEDTGSDAEGDIEIPGMDPEQEEPDPVPSESEEEPDSDYENEVSGQGPDTTVRTKSTIMVVSKIGIHDKNEDPVDELDDGEEGKVSAEIRNDGAKQDVMTDVDVDFFYVDSEGEEYYIDTDIIPYIEGDGNTSTAMVDWTADMLAQKIKVVADLDGSDGGPAEGYQDIDVTEAEFAQKLHCSYLTGSGYAEDTLEYYIKVTNIGTKEDDVKLEVQNADGWDVLFDNDLSSKTIFDMDAGEHSWEKVSVTIPLGVGGDDYREPIISATSQGNTNKVKTIMLRTTVLRSLKPILLLDRDHNQRANGAVYWAAALDDAGYGGMYDQTTGAITNANSYDLIVMDTGFVGPRRNGLTQQDQTALIDFLKNGGSLWIGGARFIQASLEPQFGKTWRWELFYKYMNVTWGAHDRRIAVGGTLNGVPGDPIGQGRSYGQNLVYNEGHSHLESIWFYANDTSSHGTFIYGENQYFGTRHHYTGSTPDQPKEYRTAYTGIDMAQIGDTYGINERGTYGHPDRADVMYNHATWLGVAPPLPKANDLGIFKIVDPAGKYIYPGDTIDINVEVANYGIRDHETSFSLEVEIEQINGAYSKTLSTNVDTSENSIPAIGWAYPGMVTVSLPWTVPNEKDAKYRFTAKLGDDLNNANNENLTYARAKEIMDIQTLGSKFTFRVFMMFCALKDTPMRIDVEVENIGSRTATFNVFVDIIEPYESGSLEYMTKEITLSPGHKRIVPFIWTADKAAGVRDQMRHNLNYRYVSDGPPYWRDVGIDLEDDDPNNNVIEHNDGGANNYLGDIMVVDFLENGEMGNHGWTVEEPWHPSVVWDKDPMHSWYCGNASSLLDGVPKYDNGVDAIMYSPVFDWTDFVPVRLNSIYRYELEQNVDYVSLQIIRLDENDIWRDVGNVNWSDENALAATRMMGCPDVGDYAGHIVQLRWVFHSDDENQYRGASIDAFIVMGNAENYFDKDLVLDTITVDPLVGDIQEERVIRVAVKNMGEVVPDKTIRVWCNVTNEQGDPQEVEMGGNKRNYSDVPADEKFTKHKVKTVNWSWVPEEYGIYNIECSVQWEDEGFPGNDRLETVGLVQYYFFFDDMEEGNPKKPEYDPWETGTEDTNGKNGDRATDDWELGSPSVGPSSTYSGSNCWGTQLDDCYSNNSRDSSFLSVHVDLRTAKDPYLIFAHWLELEAEGYDTAYVEIQKVGDSDWSVIWQNPEPERAIFYTRGWETVNISLRNWQLKDINLRFRLESDSDTSYPGWYIDDVGISGITPPQYDAKLESIELTPFYGGNIPPGESILVHATVSNVGLRDSGGSHRIKVNGKVFKVIGASENKIADLTEQEIQINSGESAVVTFNYQLPAGNGIRYRIEVRVDYEGEDPKYNGDNEDSLLIWGKEQHDASIDNLYVVPPLEDAGFPRVVTAVVTSSSNIPEGYDNDFFIDFEVRYQGEWEVLDSGSVPVTLQVGETKAINWNWTAYSYGVYDVQAEVDLEGDTYSWSGHENLQSIEVSTVEKVFSDTVDNPVVCNEEYFDSFWTGLSGSEDAFGWHEVDRGYLSRESYYVGRPTTWSYKGSMSSELVSEPIDLSGVTSATLRWYTMFHVEGGVYDNLVVYFSDNNGDDWIEQTRYPKSDYRNSSENPVSDNGWLLKEKPLYDNFFTEGFRIKFRFVTDRAINFMGVLIDDISIYITGSIKNHPPVARFAASWYEDDVLKETAYSENLINRPLPEFDEIRGNPAYNNLPLPEGGKQGGIGFRADDGLSDVVRFDASYSYDPDREQDGMEYLWDFGDGSTGNGRIVDHQYSEIPLEKFYEVKLTVEDKDELTLFTSDVLKVWLGNSAPDVKFVITDSFDTSHILNDDYGASVFYGDTLKLIPEVSDPENDRIISYEWAFGLKGKAPSTTSNTPLVDFKVGVDHLYKDKDGNDPVMPDYNSNPVEYVITLTAMDENSNSASYSLNVTVNPYALADFVSQVKLGTAILEASVSLVWRGLPDEAAPQAGHISPSRPVFVYIQETDSPDPNLGTRGGCGLCYDIRAVGSRLQNGEEGFIEAEISLPVLTSDIENYGDSIALQDDLRLEYYDEIEKRFIVVPDSYVEAVSGVKYVRGTVDHLSIYTTIIETIYCYCGDAQPDLVVTRLEFSRSPAQDGHMVEVRAFFKNNGKVTARNVDVKMYDGDNLIGDQVMDVVTANGEEVMVKETFMVSMTDSSIMYEDHFIKVYVNKQRAINEGPENYRNNDKQELLVVTSVQTTTPSFESSSLMMIVSVSMVVLASLVTLRRTNKRKEKE